MPQIFQVLRCYKCSIFQIHQTKKNNKWICKICGEKQSIKRHYGIGTGKDCRLHVQKLNKLQSEKLAGSDISDSQTSDSDLEDTNKDIVSMPLKKFSKWSHYTEENDIVEEPFSINCKGKEEGIQSKCGNKIVNDIEQIDNEGGVIKQNTQTFENKSSSKLVKPSYTSQMHTFNEVNKTSKWADFVEFNIQNNSQQDATYIYGDNISTENKIFNKECVNSSSKWVDFLDDSIEEVCTELNYTNSASNISCKDSDIMEFTVKANNPPAKDKHHSTNKSLLNLKPTDTQSIPKTVQCKELLFSMSDDQDLDSILDFKY